MPTHSDLKREAQRITSRIALKYRPERVVLFGSLANGSEHPNDIDLLVIKETQERKIKRAQNLYRSLDWSCPLDIVVRTPQEVNEGLAQKNPFYVNALKGEVLYDANH
ncbi:nucleotidyltransferase domain-containing protein [Candidatus Parcubacteria bacterium]|nr:nucleotidyltransferase domain-containing protein [Nanoarchaeota archaeon]MCG2685966.1 nucleotidyltransferase domain-containing protein [Candidatus Parcubacteria bacterium]